MRKKKEPINYLDAIRKIRHSGLSGSPSPNRITGYLETMPSIQSRVDFILGLVNHHHPKATDMLFFVMYDIEDNKVRRYIAKYLEQQGCLRVQKSIFLADLDIQKFNEIKSDIKEVQQVYDNEDSILVVPISSDYLKSMSIIGKNISIEVITRSKNTLFF